MKAPAHPHPISPARPRPVTNPSPRPTPPKPKPKLAAVAAARYVWADTYGRIAVMLVLIGTLGLTAHYWTATPLVALLPRQVGR